jgi:glycosyltransferase involved in cell wall biosynthesis
MGYSRVMGEQPLVSVIMIFFDAAEFLREAIESVTAQTYRQWELLLVDDGSGDGSSQIARQYASQDPLRILYFDHEGHQNLGMSAARNLGLRKAKGDYIAFLDADDYWLPSKLDVQLKFLASQPEVGMLFGATKYWYSWTGRPEDSRRDFVPSISVRAHTLFDPPLFLIRFLRGRVEVPCPSSILLRRATAEGIGGFEESFRGMYEDQVFYAKIALSTPVLGTDECLAWYRQHAKSASSTAIRTRPEYFFRLGFLKWLERYCSDQRVRDKRVWETVQRELWLYDNRSYRNLPVLVQDAIRWMKKWVLKVEERVLPSVLREWLWIPRSALPK